MADGRIVRFIEKDPEAPAIPGEPDKILASMGNYVFSTDALLRMVHEDAADKTQLARLRQGRAAARGWKRDRIFAYDFRNNRIPGEPGDGGNYWRDVGTVDAYFDGEHGDALAQSAAEPLQPALAAAYGELSRSARALRQRLPRQARARRIIR